MNSLENINRIRPKTIMEKLEKANLVCLKLCSNSEESGAQNLIVEFRFEDSGGVERGFKGFSKMGTFSFAYMHSNFMVFIGG